MIRQTKHLVAATERLPAQFRPQNQLLLVPSHSANPQPGDPQSMLPGRGEVRQGNGFGSNGLASGASDTRLAQKILAMRISQAQLGAMVQQAGSPNGRSRPVMTIPLSRALADLPAAPSQGALQVDMSWAGNSLQSEQWEVRDGLGLRPIKAFGKKQTFVTTKFGTDADALHAALKAQPIVSVIGIAPYVAAPIIPAVAPRLMWEHVDTIERPDGLRWIITKAPTSTGYRYAVTLYRHRADSDDEVIRSDNLSSEGTAREYIRSWEVQQGDFGGAGAPKRTVFWNNFMRAPEGGDAGLTNAAARASKAQFQAINVPGDQNRANPVPDAAIHGMGTLRRRFMKARNVHGLRGLGDDAAAPATPLSATSLPAWAIAAAAIGAFVLMTKNRYAGR